MRWLNRQRHFVTNPYDSSVPGTHEVEGENQLAQVVLWPPYTYYGTCVLLSQHTYKQMNKSILQLGTGGKGRQVGPYEFKASLVNIWDLGKAEPKRLCLKNK